MLPTSVQKFLLHCFDFIFPPRVDALVVRGLDREDSKRLYCLKTVDDCVMLSRFMHTHIPALIHEAKFHRNPKAQLLLAHLFVFYIKTNETPFDYIIPIPLSRARARARGYNQVTEILKATPEKIPPVHTDILVRIKDTAPQTSLTREKRLLNMRDAFGITHKEHIAGKHILLVDDVTTTGATLKAAKAALLLHHPASITCLALAH